MRYISFLLFLFVLYISCTPYQHGAYLSPAPANPFQYEEYASIQENEFQRPSESPLSTFSIDVDGASYSNIRRMINDGTLPPSDAVRIEEMINYFDYEYSEPGADSAFSINTKVGHAPWNPSHHIMQIGLKGKTPDSDQLSPQNLVFLIDVSGSMRGSNKLDLVKTGLRLLVEQLGKEDRIAIVVYSGRSEVALPSTSGIEKRTILRAINKLKASGSTAGSKGIQTAYRIAEEEYSPYFNNRIILATDGDFNVGITDQEELRELISRKKELGIYLTVLGFGTGNLKDYRMEMLADNGNGNYYYIDNLLEAKKVFVTDLKSTLFTIADDVKIQVEFNPYNVQAYRLIGYENRLLAAVDFNDDDKDAGELGAGHTVTALYEIVLREDEMQPKTFPVDPLRYQDSENSLTGTSPYPDELATVKLRYKEPDQSNSCLSTQRVTRDQISEHLDTDLSFLASVAIFGMLLRDSDFKGEADYSMLHELAHQGRGKDINGYRSEFIKIAELAELLSQGQSSK